MNQPVVRWTKRVAIWPLCLAGLLLVSLSACVPVTPAPSPPPVDSNPSPAPTAELAPTPTSSPQPTQTSPASQLKLVLWENLAPEQSRVLAGNVSAFEEQHPHIKIEVRRYQDNHDLVDSSQPFDLVLGDATLAAALQSQGRLESLNDLFPSQFMDSFAPAALDGISRDEKLWGLPDTVGLHLLLYYNRDLIAVPPEDTEEMYELAETFTTRKQWGLAMNSYDPVWVLPWLGAYGGWVIDEAGRATLDTPSMVNAVTLYLSWHGHLTGVAPTATYVEARQLFVDGKSAMLIDGEWAIDELNQANGVDWGVAPLPVIGETGGKATPLVSGRYWLLSGGLHSAQQEAASEFLAYATEPERQLSWTTRFGLLPTRISALEDSRILSDPWLRISAKQMQEGRGLMLGVDGNRLLDAMRGPLRSVLDGDMVPESASRAMQEGLEPQE